MLNKSYLGLPFPILSPKRHMASSPFNIFCQKVRDLRSIYYSYSTIPSDRAPLEGVRPVLNLLNSNYKNHISLVPSILVNSTNSVGLTPMADNSNFTSKSSSSPLNKSHNDDSYLNEMSLSMSSYKNVHRWERY